MATFSEIIRGETPVLVGFYAEWCGPCKVMAPILNEVKASMGEKVIILKVDVDKNQQAAAKFQVQGVPTLVLFKEGQIKWRQSGVVQKRLLEQVLTNQL